MRPAVRRMLDEITASMRERTEGLQAAICHPGGRHRLTNGVLLVGGSSCDRRAAAEALARELQLDLYRVDLSQFVSKYIGEAEKSLRRVFDAAEEGGAILFFDEAGTLFGTRHPVCDAHDRLAGPELDFVLHRMEAYSGLVVVATDKRTDLPAALRRLRFTVRIPRERNEGRETREGARGNRA